MVFAGFFILFSHMSRPMYIISYISFIAYSYEAMVQAVYGFGREPLSCPENVEYCHLKVPQHIFKELGVASETYWTNVAFLVMNFLLLRTVAFCTLKRRLNTG